jgi:hypothetical protein
LEGLILVKQRQFCQSLTPASLAIWRSETILARSLGSGRAVRALAGFDLWGLSCQREWNMTIMDVILEGRD